MAERLDRFEARKEALPGGQGLEATGGAEAVTRGDVAALDARGGLAMCSVQPWSSRGVVLS
jgi:hypothetical protein